MLTVTEAADRVGRNPETVRRWIRSGRLRAERSGRRHLIADIDLLAIEAELYPRQRRLTIHELRGRVRWIGDLDESRHGRRL